MDGGIIVNKVRSTVDIKHRQQICAELVSLTIETVDNSDLSLFETIVDEYVYRLNDTELNQLEGVINSYSQ